MVDFGQAKDLVGCSKWLKKLFCCMHVCTRFLFHINTWNGNENKQYVSMVKHRPDISNQWMNFSRRFILSGSMDNLGFFFFGGVFAKRKNEFQFGSQTKSQQLVLNWTNENNLKWSAREQSRWTGTLNRGEEKKRKTTDWNAGLLLWLTSSTIIANNSGFFYPTWFWIWIGKNLFRFWSAFPFTSQFDAQSDPTGAFFSHIIRVNGYFSVLLWFYLFTWLVAVCCPLNLASFWWLAGLMGILFASVNIPRNA